MCVGRLLLITWPSFLEPADPLAPEVIKKSGVRRIRFHDLRHTAASLMFRQGVSPKVVSTVLGHSDIAFTMRVYTHLYDDQRQTAALDLATLCQDTAPKTA